MRPTPLLALLVGLLGPALGSEAAEGVQPVLVSAAKAGPLADAVVSLVALEPGAPSAAPVANASIVQSDEQYSPFVSAVTVGSSVAFPNEDRIQHHIYSVSKAKRFEKPLYAPGSTESVVFDQPGVVALGCNIHDWMIAYLLVVGTPHYAKTNAEGRAELSGVPAGRYRLEVWHPRLAQPVTREITVATGNNAAAAFELTLRPDRRIRRAQDGKAGGY
ncbi:MAG TPA: carboxypeptidase regulatory-like domain-containing protein [Opitutaceae bacterium]